MWEDLYKWAENINIKIMVTHVNTHPKGNLKLRVFSEFCGQDNHFCQY